MSRRSTKSQASVERLLDERQQYQQWLAKLADGTSKVPKQVVDRVRSDYAARLEKVTKELGRYEKDLETALAEAEVRCEDLIGQRGKRAETLAEAELRHQVGEFDDEKFASESAELQATLAQLGEEIAAAERDRAKFEEILDLIAGALPGAAPTPPAKPSPAAPAKPAETAPPPEAAQPAQESAQPTAPAEQGLDELAFLRSVTAAAAAVKPPAPEPSESEKPPAPSAAAEPEPEAAPRAPEPPPAPEPPAANRKSAKEIHPPRTSGEADDTPKSLRCTECGTYNRPTEWYCEKCGAELSAF